MNDRHKNPGAAGEDEPMYCGSCLHYDGDVCMRLWNNGDESYYVPGRDDKRPDEYCDDWEGC